MYEKLNLIPDSKDDFPDPNCNSSNLNSSFPDLICSFTDSWKKFMAKKPADTDLLDFCDIRGTNGYCSDEAAIEIRKRLESFSPEGVHYIDDGNHHYFSLFWLEKIEKPFDLVVFDHHTDMQPPSLLPVLSCGGWILTALETLPLLRKVYLIGPEQSMLDEISEYKEKTVCLDEKKAKELISFIKTGETDSENNFLHQLTQENIPVFISVDLDILSEEEIKTVWDQGKFTFTELAYWIRFIKNSRNIIGMDICG